MTQGIFKSLEKLEDMIQAITPKTDSHQSFVAIQTGNGRTLPLDQRPNSNRYFEVETITFAEDDGLAGLSGRKRTSLELRVRYDIPNDIGFLKRLINEDASKLIDTLKGPNYDLSTTGIVSVIPGVPSTEPLADVNGELFGFVLLVPFDLLYLEN
jgi:predicted signal transduction protein with EAL and GGDEF domain